ncbi:ArsI/CadI family heavy metal resistance metalloenzyme [Comamonas odontotermitis]|uniref:ArsI/CadI family heavy metal resistance metalloenzyme n=1 Tax=Comamonas odontotermitis TaxID=379895 RepID=UPI0037516E0A
MKRFHVHMHVDDLLQNIAFYSRLFGAGPTRVESDYGRWMLEDPRVNFAISTCGHAGAGLDHLGFQVDDAAERDALKARAEAADMAMLEEGVTTCCYARSEKHWITDPQGVAWAHFHSLGNIPLFNESAAPAAPAAAACCSPAIATPAAASSCCGPRATAHTAKTCS